MGMMSIDPSWVLKGLFLSGGHGHFLVERNTGSRRRCKALWSEMESSGSASLEIHKLSGMFRTRVSECPKEEIAVPFPPCFLCFCTGSLIMPPEKTVSFFRFRISRTEDSLFPPGLLDSSFFSPSVLQRWDWGRKGSLSFVKGACSAPSQPNTRERMAFS